MAAASPNSSARVWTPSEALARTAAVVEAELRDPIWLVGEVESVSSTGRHLYLTLRDAKAQIRVAALGLDAQRIRGRLQRDRATMERGTSVRLFGTLQLYPVRGQVELRATDVDTALSVGSAELDRRSLLKTIRDGGLAVHQQSLSLPPVPLRVAIITPDGLGWRDIEARLATSPWDWRIRHVVAPSEVPRAPALIARSLFEYSPLVDLVVLARGGGSGATAAYDSEAVAAAICQARCPVIVAVGHDDDRPVAEHVAWRRESTPTAAADALDRIMHQEWAALVDALAVVVDTAEVQRTSARAALDREWEELMAEQVRAMLETPVTSTLAVTGHDRMAVSTRRRDRRVLVLAGMVLVLVAIVVVLVVTR